MDNIQLSTQTVGGSKMERVRALIDMNNHGALLLENGRYFEASNYLFAAGISMINQVLPMLEVVDESSESSENDHRKGMMVEIVMNESDWRESRNIAIDHRDGSLTTEFATYPSQHVTSDVIYRHPIRFESSLQTKHQCVQCVIESRHQVEHCNSIIVRVVAGILFNCALTYHLLSYQISDRVERLGLLLKGLTLYEHGLSLHNGVQVAAPTAPSSDSRNNGRSEKLFNVAVLNNLGMVQLRLGRRLCGVNAFQRLLQYVAISIPESGSANINGSTISNFIYEPFIQNAMEKILTSDYGINSPNSRKRRLGIGNSAPAA